MTETRIPVMTASPTSQQGPLAVVVAMAWLAQIMDVIDSTPGGFPEWQGEDAFEDGLESAVAAAPGPHS